MAVNKVQYGNTTLIDLSQDTVASAADIVAGKVGHLRDGSVVTGTGGGGGGASNVVTGTFKGTTTGAAMDVTLNYSGSGYPVAVLIYPEEGPYNANEGSMYDLVQRQACLYYVGMKSESDTTPSYSDTTSKNGMSTYQYRKNSTTSATTYTGTASNGANVLHDTNAVSNNGGRIVHLKSSTKMSVFIASNSYGFAANITYKYWVLYSS